MFLFKPKKRPESVKAPNSTAKQPIAEENPKSRNLEVGIYGNITNKVNTVNSQSSSVQDSEAQV